MEFLALRIMGECVSDGLILLLLTSEGANERPLQSLLKIPPEAFSMLSLSSLKQTQCCRNFLQVPPKIDTALHLVPNFQQKKAILWISFKTKVGCKCIKFFPSYQEWIIILSWLTQKLNNGILVSMNGIWVSKLSFFKEKSEVLPRK